MFLSSSRLCVSLNLKWEVCKGILFIATEDLIRYYHYIQIQTEENMKKCL